MPSDRTPDGNPPGFQWWASSGPDPTRPDPTRSWWLRLSVVPICGCEIACLPGLNARDDRMIVRIRAHASDPNVVALHAGPECAAAMGRFQFARYDNQARVYLIAINHLETFLRNAPAAGLTVVDQRAEVGTSLPVYDPLPECSECHMPVPRAMVDRLQQCPSCDLPWMPMRFEPGYRPGDPDQPPALGRLRAREALALALGHPMSASGPAVAVRAVPCPWCGVPAGRQCTVIGSERTIRDGSGRVIGISNPRNLRHATGHAARHEAAGVPMRIDAQMVASRRSTHVAPVPEPEEQPAHEPDPEVELPGSFADAIDATPELRRPEPPTEPDDLLEPPW